VELGRDTHKFGMGERALGEAAGLPNRHLEAKELARGPYSSQNKQKKKKTMNRGCKTGRQLAAPIWNEKEKCARQRYEKPNLRG